MAQATATVSNPTSQNFKRKVVKFPYLRFILLVLMGVFWVAPVLWMFVTSIKPEVQIISSPPRWLADNWGDYTLDHYINVLTVPRGVNLIQAFLNSILVASIGTALVVTVDVLAGYAFARMKFPGRDVLFALVVASIIVPVEIILIPNYITIWRLGWLNSYYALIFPALAGGFGVFLMRQFLLGIPREIEDAAAIDGCGRFRMLWDIIIPLSRGAIATLAIFTFLFFWNDFTWPYIIINEASKMTMPVALIQFRGDYFSEYGRRMAGTAVSAIPAIIVFLAAQRMIIRSISLTGVKG